MISNIREKLKNESFLVNSIVILLVLLFLVWLMIDYFSSEKRQGDPIGKVTNKSNKINRKYGFQSIWKDLTLNSDVYNLDTIKTDEMSKITIILNDKTEILIDENSMVVLDMTGDLLNINLVKGDLQLNAMSSTGNANKNYIVKSGDSEVKLNQGGAMRLNKSPDSALELNVREGKVEYKKGNIKQEISKNEELKVRGDKIKKTQRKFHLLQPTHSKIYTTSQKNHTVTFEWDGEEANYILEIFSISNGLKKVLEQKVSDTSFSKELSAGKYTWKLSNENKTETQTEHFFIVDESPVQAYTPIEDAKFTYLQELPKILFSWNKNEFTPIYQLEISKTRDFALPLVRFETQNESTVLDTMSEGKYYYRIVSKTDSSDPNPKMSKTRSFTISRQKGPSKPELLSPNNSQQYSTKDRITFTWKSMEEFSHYRIQLSNDKNFASIFKTVEVQTNFINWQEQFKEGEYFWRIEGKVKGSQSWLDSDVRKIKITNQPIVVPKLTLLSPPNKEEISSDSVQFSWNSNTKNNHFLEISEDSSFKTLLQSISTMKQSHQLTTLKPAQYYWRIRTQVEEENFYSDIYSFQLVNYPAPIIESPRQPALFDVIKEKTALFRWTKLKNIQSYHIEIWKDGKKIQSNHSNKNEWKIDNLTTLKPGSYTFRLVANYSNRDGKKILSKPTVLPFKVYLSQKIQKEDIQFKSPETIYIE